MSPLETALAAWIAFHAELGTDIEALLRPPATEAALEAAERELGVELPEDLRELYRIADGQIDPWDERERGGRPDHAALFGHYLFLPLEAALAERTSRIGDHDERGEGHRPSVVRSGDSVDLERRPPDDFVFARDGGGNGYAVDLSPPRGGRYGQVILVGPDEPERRVLAPSVTELMARAAERLDPGEPHRYEIGEDEDGRYAYFDMDWTRAPTVPPSAEEMGEEMAISEAWNAAFEADRTAFARWLEASGIDTVEREAILDFFALERGMQPPLFGEPWSRDADLDLVHPTRSVAAWMSEVEVALAMPLRACDGTDHVHGTRRRAFERLARYRFESGAWTDAEYAGVREMLARAPREITLDGCTGAYTMERRENGSFRVCVFGDADASDPDCP